MKAANTLFEHVGPIAGFVLVPLIAAHRSREPALQTARQSKARFQKEAENGRDQSPCSRGQARCRTAID
jgi:hypothetical protein